MSEKVTIDSRLVTAVCVAVLAIVLAVGLSPFVAPVNEVSWLAGRNGLAFGHRGSAISAAPFHAVGDGSSATLELSLQPFSSRGTYTVFSFEGLGTRVPPFSLQQHGPGLEVRRHNIDDGGTDRIGVFEVANVFHAETPVFLTVALQPQKTIVYVNGAQAAEEPISGLSQNNFTGRMVLADSPITSDGWPGEMFHVAIFGRELSAQQVAARYAARNSAGSSPTAAEESPLALYRMSEGSGSVVRNEINSATNLGISSRYRVLHVPFLLAPQKEFRNTRQYWQDFGINLLGFIPFGFCFAAWFSGSGMRWPVLATIALGFATSLTIESLQVLLPTRDSSMTDLLNNTAGTAIGALLFTAPLTKRILRSIFPWIFKQKARQSRPLNRITELEMVTSDSARLP